MSRLERLVAQFRRHRAERLARARAPRVHVHVVFQGAAPQPAAPAPVAEDRPFVLEGPDRLRIRGKWLAVRRMMGPRRLWFIDDGTVTPAAVCRVAFPGKNADWLLDQLDAALPQKGRAR